MNKLRLEEKLRRFQVAKASMMKAIANNSVNFFKIKTFNAQGWIPSAGVVSRWKPRKTPDKTKRGKVAKKQRKILVKTGHGRQSIHVAYVNIHVAVIRAEAYYMQYHNEGTPKMPKRQFMGDSDALYAENMKIVKRHMRGIL